MTYDQLLDSLAGVGLLDDRWRPGFEQVPRHLFIPDVAMADTGPELVRIDRRRDPDGWAAAVNSDRVIVTQQDDGAGSADQPGRSPSSSSSMPLMVATMLAACQIEDGYRVLEIGTGTGWNAGLLAGRLGDGQVVSVEIDPQVAEQARKALAGAGLHPAVVVGDGEEGCPRRAPFDRVLATCSIYCVPYSWVEQIRPGGLVVTPWRDPFCHAGKLLRLEVAGDGIASGRFLGWASFMMSRPQRMPTDEVPGQGGTSGATDLHPGLPLDGDHAESAVGMAVPDCQWWREGSGGGYEVRLDDVASRSWAAVGPLNDDERRPYLVRQGGPRRLWDEVEAAYGWWVDVGRPDLTRFGITVTPDRQWVWLDEPGCEVGRVTGRS